MHNRKKHNKFVKLHTERQFIHNYTQIIHNYLSIRFLKVTSLLFTKRIQSDSEFVINEFLTIFVFVNDMYSMDNFHNKYFGDQLPLGLCINWHQ